MKNEFYFISKDKETEIRCIEWIPENKPKAVLQICHGMCEYVARYDDFAQYLTKHGFYVVGNDHLGHGKSVQDDDHLGYFHETNGNSYLMGDMEQLRQITVKKYPDIPYFLLGHSMGAFLTEQFITMQGSSFDGVVIMGTGYLAKQVLNLGKKLCLVMAKKHGWFYRSDLMKNISFGGYNKRIKPLRTPMDWLTRDEEIIDKYNDDPWCTFTFTLNGFYNMFKGIEEAQKESNIAYIPKNLPILLVSGDEDPVGGYGKGVKSVYNAYKKAEIKDVEMKFYEGMRHEILNEIGKESVYEDLRKWMESYL